MNFSIIRIVILLLSLLIFEACGPSRSFEVSQELQPLKPTSFNSTNQYTSCNKSKSLCFTANAIDAKQVTITKDEKTNQIRAKGKIFVKNNKNIKFKEIDIEVYGTIQMDGRAILKPMENNNSDSKISDSELIRAAATCKDKNEDGSFTCNDLIVDFFYKSNSGIYSTQTETSKKIETNPTINTSTSPTQSQTPTSKKEDNKDTSNSGERSNQNTTETNEDSFNDSEDDSLPDRYVGLSFDEISTLLSPQKNNTAPDKPSDSTNPPKSTETPTAISPSRGCGINFICDIKGNKIRPIDQAYGSAASKDARLTNATDLLTKQNELGPNSFFEIRNPTSKRYFLTYELSIIIEKIARTLNESLGHYKLGVADCSLEKGGKISSHLSHRNGLDVDLPYVFKNEEKAPIPMTWALENKKIISKNFDIQTQWLIFKMLIQTDKVDRIFIHQNIKKEFCNAQFVKSELKDESKKQLATETLRRLRPRPTDHHDHYHLRLLCSPYDKRCQMTLPPPEGSGCT